MNNKLGFGGGPMFDPFLLSTIALDVFFLTFILHFDMYELYFVFINCALILFHDSAFVTRGPGTYPLTFCSFFIHVLIPIRA